MKYPYHVKHDGVMYKPGEEVPDNVVMNPPIEDEKPIVEELPEKGKTSKKSKK